MSTTSDVLVDAVALRDQVRDKYRAVATDPAGPFPFHTGRELARRLGYDIANGRPVPEGALRAIDLWTG